MKIHFFLFVIFSAVAVRAQSLNEFEWLTGQWVNFTEKDSSFEVWNKDEDGNLSGYGLTIINGDTVFYEDLKIFMSNDTIYYQAKIENQNSGMPVLFRYIKKGSDYNFLNRDHDFPQKIVYTPVNDTLYIRLEGIEAYYEKRIDFFYIRR